MKNTGGLLSRAPLSGAKNPGVIPTDSDSDAGKDWRATIAKTLSEYLDDLLAPLYALHRDPTEQEREFVEVFLRDPRERSRS